MKENVGTLDAYLRISIGLIMVASGISKRSILKMALGSSKVAEGITRFCPMLHLMNKNTISIESKKNKSALKSKPTFYNL